jgi:hypothetical protein
LSASRDCIVIPGSEGIWHILLLKVASGQLTDRDNAAKAVGQAYAVLFL